MLASIPKLLAGTEKLDISNGASRGIITDKITPPSMKNLTIEKLFTFLRKAYQTTHITRVITLILKAKPNKLAVSIAFLFFKFFG